MNTFNLPLSRVSKFSLSDVFSGANHLSDLTIDKSAAAMFGYTGKELLEVCISSALW